MYWKPWIVWVSETTNKRPKRYWMIAKPLRLNGDDSQHVWKIWYISFHTWSILYIYSKVCSFPWNNILSNTYTYVHENRVYPKRNYCVNNKNCLRRHVKSRQLPIKPNGWIFNKVHSQWPVRYHNSYHSA